MAHLLAPSSQAIIIGATNGDTGVAAIEAFKNVANVEVVALYPRYGVAPERLAELMVSNLDHVRLIEVNGSFDDCQTIVSKVLRAWPLEDVLPISFNSTNWVGVLAQIVFFFHSALQLGGGERPVGFSIPGASFAEIYACFIAQKWGWLSIRSLCQRTPTTPCIALSTRTAFQPVKRAVLCPRRWIFRFFPTWSGSFGSSTTEMAARCNTSWPISRARAN